MKRGRSSIGCPLTRKSEPARATLAMWAGSDGTTDGIAVSGRWTTVDVWAIASSGQSSPRIQVVASGHRGRWIDHFKTAGRHPWRCRRTDRSRRAPAISKLGKRCPKRPSLLTAVVIASPQPERLQPDRQSAGGRPRDAELHAATNPSNRLTSGSGHCSVPAQQEYDARQ